MVGKEGSCLRIFFFVFALGSGLWALFCNALFLLFSMYLCYKTLYAILVADWEEENVTVGFLKAGKLKAFLEAGRLTLFFCFVCKLAFSDPSRVYSDEMGRPWGSLMIENQFDSVLNGGNLLYLLVF